MREKMWSFFAFFCWLPLFITNVWSKADEQKFIFDTLSCWFFSFKIETIEREEEFVGEEDDQDNPDQGKIGL